MLVLIAGMPRSGSTFSFNIAKEALALTGPVEHVADRTLLPYAGRGGTVIVKAHELDAQSIELVKAGAVKVICTYRTPEDAIASWMDTFGYDIEASIETILAWLEMYRAIAPHALTISYDDIERSPREVAAAIARHLMPNVHPLHLSKIWRDHAKANVLKRVAAMERGGPGVVDLGFSFNDADTLYHRRHVTQLEPQTASDRLSTYDLAHIRWRLECAGHLSPPSTFQVKLSVPAAATPQRTVNCVEVMEVVSR